MKRITVTNAKDDAANLRNSSNCITDDLIEKVKSIMDNVAKHGDSAIIDYIEKFDSVRVNSLKVTEDEVKQAYRNVTTRQIQSVNLIKKRLMKTEMSLFKKLKGITISFDGVTIKRVIQPISNIGCYIPGGKARYPSTMIMCAIPAKVVGVKRIVAVSPPMKDGMVDSLTLVAADICGVNEFYKMGGAQAISALTFGTSSINRVDKIVGPGGLFVTIAKILASSKISVDMVAGPTEVLIYADSNADARLIAVDLISQSEHSSDTLCGLVTTSEELALRVSNNIQAIIANGIERNDIVRKSLESRGFIAICNDESTAIDFINEIAPEHLEIMVRCTENITKKITSAGLILTGKYTPSSASDYCLGSNHVLPTLGFSRSRASLSILDFIKIVNVVKSSKAGLQKIETDIKEITSAEGLINHYKAIKERI
jgi:histidinol dehydrogenase